MVDVDQDLAGVVSILTLGVGLTALFLGFDWFWMVFVLGWVVFTPLAGMLAGDDEAATAEPTGSDATADDGVESTDDALETLRDRYARGALTEEQFERKVERLLETETVEDARDRVAGAGEERVASGDRDREREAGTAREPEREREP